MRSNCHPPVACQRAMPGAGTRLARSDRAGNGRKLARAPPPMSSCCPRDNSRHVARIRPGAGPPMGHDRRMSRRTRGCRSRSTLSGRGVGDRWKALFPTLQPPKAAEELQWPHWSQSKRMGPGQSAPVIQLRPRPALLEVTKRRIGEPPIGGRVSFVTEARWRPARAGRPVSLPP